MKRTERKDPTGARLISYELNNAEVTDIVTAHLIGLEDFGMATGTYNWIIQDDQLFGMQFNVTAVDDY